MTILSGASNTGMIRFGDSGNSNIGGITYNHTNNQMQFITNGTSRMTITNTGITLAVLDRDWETKSNHSSIRCTR